MGVGWAAPYGRDRVRREVGEGFRTDLDLFPTDFFAIVFVFFFVVAVILVGLSGAAGWQGKPNRLKRSYYQQTDRRPLWSPV